MFSIVIPAYNEEKYISKCLESIKKLKGSFEYEVIVVNNASTDDTAGVVKKVMPEAKVVFELQKGLTVAYNRGAKEARGDILVFVDADVILPPNHLERISKEFKKDPKLILLSGPYIYRDGGSYAKLMLLFGVFCVAMPAEIVFNRFLNIGSGMTSGNSAVKKEIFIRVGGFNEKIFYGLESEFTKRVSRFGKVRYALFWVESSARRLKKEGALRTLIRYIFNVVWPNLFGKPFTKNHIDIR